MACLILIFIHPNLHTYILFSLTRLLARCYQIMSSTPVTATTPENTDEEEELPAFRRLPVEVLEQIVSFLPGEQQERRRAIMAWMYVCKEWAPKMEHV